MPNKLPRFEDEYPEEAGVLMQLCQERAKKKTKKKKLKPMFLNATHQIGVTKIGRNAPCPCGSGKKYKKCCIMNE
jgi:uncharacterized protein YecA (UPF0149 family)